MYRIVIRILWSDTISDQEFDMLQEFEIPDFLSQYWHRLSGIFFWTNYDTNKYEYQSFCVTTDSDEPIILKGGFHPIKTHDVCKCFSRSNPILCIRLSKNLQSYTSKRHDFKYKKSSSKVKNFVYNSMSFDSLFAERDRRDFGLSRCIWTPTGERAKQVWCDFDMTTISISWNNHLRFPGSLRQLPQLYNKKLKNIFMFMRYVHTTAQDLEARSVAVVVEFSQRSNVSNSWSLIVITLLKNHAWPGSTLILVGAMVDIRPWILLGYFCYATNGMVCNVNFCGYYERSSLKRLWLTRL
jgi:hypothetical protein